MPPTADPYLGRGAEAVTLSQRTGSITGWCWRALAASMYRPLSRRQGHKFQDIIDPFRVTDAESMDPESISRVYTWERCYRGPRRRARSSQTVETDPNPGQVHTNAFLDRGGEQRTLSLEPLLDEAAPLRKREKVWLGVG